MIKGLTLAVFRFNEDRPGELSAGGRRVQDLGCVE
jgi:hypothetical protein